MVNVCNVVEAVCEHLALRDPSHTSAVVLPGESRHAVLLRARTLPFANAVDIIEYRRATASLVDEYNHLCAQPIAWCRDADDSKTTQLGELHRRLWVLTERYAPGFLRPPPTACGGTLLSTANKHGGGSPTRTVCALCCADMQNASGYCDVCNTVLYEVSMNSLVAVAARVTRLSGFIFFLAVLLVGRLEVPKVLFVVRHRSPDHGVVRGVLRQTGKP